MTCGLKGQKHMAVDNFPSLLCQSGVTPHLRSLWWCEPMAVANCLGGIRYAGQVSKRERGTLAWHRNERHANCFPVCHQATALWTIKSQSWEAFPVSLARSVSHPCLFLSQSLHRIHLSLLSDGIRFLLFEQHMPVYVHTHFFLSNFRGHLVWTWQSLNDTKCLRWHRAISNHEVLHGMIW